MSGIEAALQQPSTQAVGWALVHFLWQGALIGALTALALVALRRSAADVRYVVAAIGLSLMLTMPIVTGMQVWNATAPGPSAALPIVEGVRDAGLMREGRTPAATPEGAPALESSTSAQDTVGTAFLNQLRLEPWLPLMVLAWFCGVAILTLRLLSGWLWVQRMKSHGAVAAADGWQFMAARLARRLHLRRRVLLLESSLVDVPAVIGWMKPVILLPASALAGLAPAQLEAILAHELAHIRRHDYLVNLMQTIVETLLFYHPAVWWLSRRIRTERENCCDDLAVSLCGDPYTYAQALADLEELRSSDALQAGHKRKGQLVMAANGGSLLQRVRRLIGPADHGRDPGWLAGSAAIFVMLGMAAGAVSRDAQALKTPESMASAAAASELPPFNERAIQILDEQDPPTPPTPPEPPPAPPSPPTPRTGHVPDVPAPPASPTPRTAQIPDVPAPVAPPAPPTPRTRQVPAVPAPPAPPAAPAPPAPPAPPASPVDGSWHVNSKGQSGNISWSSNGERVDIKYTGTFEFSDDDSDVVRLSPGGYIRISDGAWLGRHSVELRADAQGAITRRYWIGSSEKPFDPEGREWLKTVLPRFIRQSGLGAAGRVARILKASGPGGVLAEISLIEGGWAKRIYFEALLNTASLDAPMVTRLLEQAGREMKSDYELASLLIAGADKLLVNDSTRKAYFDSVRTIASDYEMRRVYSAALKKGPVSPALLAGILDASRALDSDYEAASLLVQVAELQTLDGTTRAPFFAALATVSSDYEKRRVLGAVGRRSDLPQDTVAAMLEAGAGLSSDYEAASFLVQVATQIGIEGAIRDPFFRAVDGIDSGYERGRVLQTVLKRTGVSADTVKAVLRATRGMSGHEASQVLLAAAAAHPLTGEARDLYVDAAEGLGDYEQGRVLAALVRNERRK